MAKKYVPSGYQIIDLGSHDLSSAVTITKGTNADADVLIDLYEREKLIDKPILLKVHDSNGSYSCSGFMTYSGDTGLLCGIIASLVDIIIEFGSNEITIRIQDNN